MCIQVIICTIGKPPQLFKSKWKLVFQIFCTLTIERAFFICMCSPPQIFFLYSQFLSDKCIHCFFPILKQLFPIRLIGIKEVLYFSLLKFNSSKNRIPWSNFISKGFSKLCYTKWQTHS